MAACSSSGIIYMLSDPKLILTTNLKALMHYLTVKISAKKKDGNNIFSHQSGILEAPKTWITLDKMI